MEHTWLCFSHRRFPNVLVRRNRVRFLSTLRSVLSVSGRKTSDTSISNKISRRTVIYELYQFLTTTFRVTKHVLLQSLFDHRTAYQIDPGVQVSRFVDSFSLALIFEADFQVPVRPCDECAGIFANHQFVQAKIVLRCDVGDPLLKQVQCGG